MTKGTKVKNQYGKVLTVLSVKGVMITTYEESNSPYHFTKLYKI